MTKILMLMRMLVKDRMRTFSFIEQNSINGRALITYCFVAARASHTKRHKKRWARPKIEVYHISFK
ncbi:MAG: hypothetical protein CMK71_14825 [Pseudomonadaceae bacterium]|nr:hypothetical protein [Pseudomonadaceae bacterium]